MKSVRIQLDACAHVDPAGDVPRLLLAAMDRMPRRAPTDQRALVLGERGEECFFLALAQDEFRLPGDRWRIVAWDPAGGLRVRHLPDHRDIWILAGRQTASAEGLDIGALFVAEPVATGLSARETIRAIVAAGGLAALAWLPGRWTPGLKRLAEALISEFSSAQLVLTDTALRPQGWPLPRLYAAARRQGRAILAGSDPLPLGKTHFPAGTYHGTLMLPPGDDPSRLVTPLQAALVSPNIRIAPCGRRGTALAVFRRLRRHAP